MLFKEKFDIIRVGIIPNLYCNYSKNKIKIYLKNGIIVKMEKKELAKIINKDIKTLYNWEKTNPNLYNALNDYFSKKENNPIETKLLELFEKLNEKEKNFYLADMEARILKKEIDWN